MKKQMSYNGNHDLKISMSEAHQEILLTQAESAVEAPPTPPKQDLLSGFMPLILMFFAFYFLLIMPKNKKRKELLEKIKTVKKDDKVITIGGIVATVDHVASDDLVVIKTDDKNKITILKSSISEVNPTVIKSEIK